MLDRIVAHFTVLIVTSYHSDLGTEARFRCRWPRETLNDRMDHYNVAMWRCVPRKDRITDLHRLKRSLVVKFLRHSSISSVTLFLPTSTFTFSTARMLNSFYETQLVVMSGYAAFAMLLERHISKRHATQSKENASDPLLSGNTMAGGGQAAARALSYKYLVVYAVVMGESANKPTSAYQ